MSFDIYGERLERGHCEVHPWVHQEYPCGLCIRERDDNERYRREESARYEELERQHYAEMFAADCAPWFEVKQS